jgi:Zn-dependent M28 family amino/carboxypeptidase
MSPRTLALLAAVAVLAACAGAASRPYAPDVSRQRLEAHVRFLASDALEGRMTGTTGYRAAAEYVASQFGQLGLEPAGTAGYFQDVEYASALIDPQRSAVRLHRGGKARALAWKQDWVAGGDVLRERSSVRAAAVFVGHGVQAPELGHDDFAGLDLRGKIAVVLDGAPKAFDANARAYYSSGRVKDAAAVKHGAIGVVGLRNAYSIKQYAWDSLVQNAGRVPSMRWVTPEGHAADYFTELRASAGLSEAAAAALFEGAPATYAQVLEADAAGAAMPRFALAGEIELDRRSTVTRARAPNVIARLPGSDPALAGEHVVYTAHLDHLGVGNAVNGDAIYNGMYDNAMGIAMLLESARALAAAKPRRSVLFVVVGGEERGLLGSDYFAHHPTVPIDRIVANVNLDMPLLLYPIADVVAFGSEHSALGAVVAAAAEAEGLRLAPDPLPDEVIFIRSDQYSLVRQGVPAVFLVPGFTSSDPAIKGGDAFGAFLKTHYHKPSDDLTRPVDWDSAERFTRVNVRIGLATANAAAAPTWHPGNFFGERFARPRS